MIQSLLINNSTLNRFKGSRELADSDKYEMSKQGDTYVLMVHNVFGEDADEYCIKATTGAGSRSSRADLLIKSKKRKSYQSPNFYIINQFVII